MAIVRKSWNGNAVKADVHAAAAKGLYIAAEHLLGEAHKLVPLEEGTLENSGAASVDAGKLKAAVSFDTPYAVIQHEETTYEHDEGRSAKYLEKPFNAEADTMSALVARQIRKATGD